MPKGERSRSTCKACQHQDLQRLNFLLAAGQPVAAVARQFGLQKDGVHRHFQNHVSDRFKAAVHVGPYKSADDLLKLAADSGVSVLEHLRSLVAVLGAQLAIEQEAGAGARVVATSREMRETLGAIARFSGLYLPPGRVTNIQNNIIQIGWLSDFGRDLVQALADIPEAQGRVIALIEHKLAQPAPIEAEGADAA